MESVPRLGARAAALLYVAALAARLAVAAFGGLGQSQFGDHPAYVMGAQELVKNGRYPDRKDVMFFRPPAYPLFLAVTTLGHPESIARDKITSAAAAALTAPLLAALSARLFRRRGLALATGAAAAFHPAFLYVGADIMTETTFLPLLLGAGALLLAAADRPSANLALCAGVLLAGAALTRPSALALSPLLAAPLADRRWPLRARAHLAAAGIFGFALALAPWTARNYVLFHEFIPVSDEGGASFFDGNSKWANRVYDVKDRREVEPLIIAMHVDKTERLKALGPAVLSSPSRRSAAFVRFAIEDRKADPKGTLRLLGHKLWHWLRPYPTLFWGAPVVLGFGALYLVLYVFAGIGFARASRRGPVVFAAAVLVISMTLHVALLVLWRYRTPYVDPILLLWGLFGASDTLEKRWMRPS